jgi:hypothetical protein
MTLLYRLFYLADIGAEIEVRLARAEADHDPRRASHLARMLRDTDRSRACLARQIASSPEDAADDGANTAPPGARPLRVTEALVEKALSQDGLDNAQAIELANELRRLRQIREWIAGGAPPADDGQGTS